MTRVKEDIIPIFIIGAARNGTTQLGNAVGAFKDVVSVEHKLHYGSCEVPLYELNRFWGSLNNLDRYIDFLYNFSSTDYFQLAQGDLSYHLKHRTTNVYDFFFELMDRYAIRNKKKFWVTKFDPSFFGDRKERIRFLNYLNTRYFKIKHIIIQRDLKDSLVSYLQMEGARYAERQNVFKIVPALLLQTSRYCNVYKLSNKDLKHDKLTISFEEFIHPQNNVAGRIANFIGTDNFEVINNYKPNTSFVKTQKKSLSKINTVFINFLTALFNAAPFLAVIIQKMAIQLSKPKNFVYRRLLKNQYFKNDLLKELEQTHAIGLINELKNEVNESSI